MTTSSPRLHNARRSLLLLGATGLLLLAAAPACSSGRRTVVKGVVTDYDGAPLAGVRVTSERVTDLTHVDPSTLDGVVTAADGTFSLQLTGSDERIVLTAVAAKGAAGATTHAPSVAIVKRKANVRNYRVTLHLPAVTHVDASSGSAEVSAGGRTTTIRFPADARGTFTIAAIGTDRGMPLRAEGAPPSLALQSAGMVYITPDPGAELGGGVVQIVPDPSPVPDVPDAEPFQAWDLDDNGGWANPSPVESPTGPAPLGGFGFWNLDRNFRTACVKGRAKAPAGKTCGGQQVRQVGPDGIASADNAGADGSFCVTGAQTFPASIAIGSQNVSASMPANAGNCESPDTCADLGEVEMSEADCPDDEEEKADEPKKPAPDDDEGGGGAFDCRTAYECDSDLMTRSVVYGQGCCSLDENCWRACADGCGNTWYEALGRVYGPCRVGPSMGECMDPFARAVVNDCSKADQ